MFFLGQIAQSVEQRTENPRVGGSIPSRPSTFLKLFASDQSRAYFLL